MRTLRRILTWGRCPQTPGIFRFAARMGGFEGAGYARPRPIPAAESALGLRSRIALSSAQVLPEWTTSTSPCNNFLSNGDNPLNSLSHSKGSLHRPTPNFAPAIHEERATDLPCTDSSNVVRKDRLWVAPRTSGYGTIHVPRVCKPLVSILSLASIRIVVCPANECLNANARFSVSVFPIPPPTNPPRSDHTCCSVNCRPILALWAPDPGRHHSPTTRRFSLCRNPRGIAFSDGRWM